MKSPRDTLEVVRLNLVDFRMDHPHIECDALDRAEHEVEAALATPDFQARAVGWVRLAFGSEPADCKLERAWRFLEEALELAQAAGVTEDDTLRLAEHVFARPVGEVAQEVGGAMLTLAPLAQAYGVSMSSAAEAELARVNTPEVLEKCRRKNATKLPHSPLPGTGLTPAQAFERLRASVPDGVAEQMLAEVLTPKRDYVLTLMDRDLCVYVTDVCEDFQEGQDAAQADYDKIHTALGLPLVPLEWVGLRSGEEVISMSATGHDGDDYQVQRVMPRVIPPLKPQGAQQ